MSLGERRFGRYRLGERLGEGGMAEVWRAHLDGAEGFSRQLVLKRIRRDLCRDPRFVKMFLAEARLCARLHHGNIVQVFDLGEVDGEYFLAMEYVDGRDLAALLKRASELGRPVPPGLAAYLGAELAQALAYAHALTGDDGQPLGIVHRDVSPSNILISSTGAPKLVDFGIAKAAVGDERTRTGTGTLKGKVHYMSPEQADGRKIDRRSDVFALGVVLYECLTLERPFAGDDELETLRLVREARVWPPSSRRPEIEPDVDAVVLRMLAQNPDARYASCEEVAAALAPLMHRHHGDAPSWKRWIGDLGPFSPPAPVTTAGKKSPNTVTGSLGELRQEPRPALPRRWSVIGVALAVIGVAAVIAAWPRPPAAPVTPTATAPRVEPKPQTKKEEPPAQVHLVVAGTEGADVAIDGHLVGQVPLSIDLPRAAGSREIRVSRAGYRPLLTRIVADADGHVDARLVARKKPLANGDIRDPFAE
jgi:serine/threonine protein kinase